LPHGFAGALLKRQLSDRDVGVICFDRRLDEFPAIARDGLRQRRRLLPVSIRNASTHEARQVNVCHVNGELGH